MKSLYTCDENRITGTIGAILGGLVGYALWIFCGYYFLVPGIVGFVCALLILKGYVLFAGSMSRAGMIICIIVGILWISVSELGCVMMHLYFDWGMRDLPEILGNVPVYVQTKGLLPRMIGNTVFGITTSLIGCFNMYFKIWKETEKGPKENVTMDNEDPEIPQKS
jgi:hypothetical protein